MLIELPRLPDFGIAYILWVGVLAMGAVALLQILYFSLLLIPKRGSRPVRQPNAPLMPTQPANLDARKNQPLSAGGKMAVLSGLENTDDIPLPNANFMIGRYYHPENNIHVALDEKSISRRHAQFQGDDTRREYTLTDTNSSYGTALRANDKLQQLTPGQKFRIYNGDVIQFGQQVTVRFSLPGDMRPAADNSARA
jgi:pSer/pThr/pTyr-binding forkhead associated (FHA) protein